jgi:hypothetical protein
MLPHRRQRGFHVVVRSAREDLRARHYDGTTSTGQVAPRIT